MVDLQKFCDDETEIGARMSITTPWSAGKNTFASNGHIIIRVERRADVPARKNAPVLTELSPWFFKEPEKWYAIPAVSPEVLPCDACNGKGKFKYDGKPFDCEECNGTGNYLHHKVVDIGPAKFSDVYLSFIAELPGAEIGPMGPIEPARFRFQGGEGLLMPRRS